MKITTQLVELICTENVHETYCILLSNPRFLRSNFVVGTINSVWPLVVQKHAKEGEVKHEACHAILPRNHIALVVPLN
jgi:hypothetical protein